MWNFKASEREATSHARLAVQPRKDAHIQPLTSIEMLKVERLRSEYASAEKLPGWGMTKLREFNPDAFRLIAHGFMVGWRFETKSRTREDLELFLRDERKRTGLISCSVIDQVHLATHGSEGFIMTVPSSAITISSPIDILVFHNTKHPKLTSIIDKGDFVGKIDINGEYVRNDIGTAQGILDETPYDFNNEIRIRGDCDGISVDGGFIGIWKDGRPITPHAARRIEDVCKENGLPVIYIKHLGICGAMLVVTQTGSA